MDVVKLLIFMDNLRYERKLTQETYLQDIISQRQYYRYLYGESNPPLEVIIKLSKKLNLAIDRLINQYKLDEENEGKEVQKYFNYVINKELDKAKAMFIELSNKKIMNNINKMFIDLAKTLFDFNIGTISKIELVERVKKIIDFERLMKNEVLNDIELYMLGLIMEYSNRDRKNILEKILYLRKRGKILASGNRLYNTQVYFWITKNLGRLNMLYKVIEISEKAIEYCNKEYSHYLLEYFYYYKMLAYHKLENRLLFENGLMELIKILYTLKSEKVDKFRAIILQDTGLNIDEFFKSKYI